MFSHFYHKKVATLNYDYPQFPTFFTGRGFNPYRNMEHNINSNTDWTFSRFIIRPKKILNWQEDKLILVKKRRRTYLIKNEFENINYLGIYNNLEMDAGFVTIGRGQSGCLMKLERPIQMFPKKQSQKYVRF